MRAQLRISGFVLAILLVSTCICAAQPYIVTDLKGNPQASGSPLHLLTKVEELSVIELKKGDVVTLTCLTDSARATLVGPLSGKIVGHTFRGIDVFQQKGREKSLQEIRHISSTLGAGAIRSSVPDSTICSRGKVLQPILSWTSNRDYPLHKVVLSRDDTQVWESAEVENLWIDLAEEYPYPLERGVEYTITLTPLRQGPEGSIEAAPPRKATFELASQELFDEATVVGDDFVAQFSTDPSDLTPLTLYLAYLGQNKLYFDALRLLNSSYFEKEIDFKVTRDHVWNQLIPQH